MTSSREKEPDFSEHIEKEPDFSAYMKAYKIGSGVWFMVHLRSCKITTMFDIDASLSDITLLREYFTCLNCRGHFEAFCQKYPPSIEANKDRIDIDQGVRPEHLAKWFVEAHNNATQANFDKRAETQKLDKRPSFVRYSDVRKFFDSINQMPCVKDCDVAPEEKEKEGTATKIATKQRPTATKSEAHNWVSSSSPKKKPLRIRVVASPT